MWRGRASESVDERSWRADEGWSGSGRARKCVSGCDRDWAGDRCSGWQANGEQSGDWGGRDANPLGEWSGRNSSRPAGDGGGREGHEGNQPVWQCSANDQRWGARDERSNDWRDKSSHYAHRDQSGGWGGHAERPDANAPASADSAPSIRPLPGAFAALADGRVLGKSRGRWQGCGAAPNAPAPVCAAVDIGEQPSTSHSETWTGIVEELPARHDRVAYAVSFNSEHSWEPHGQASPVDMVAWHDALKVEPATPARATVEIEKRLGKFRSEHFFAQDAEASRAAIEVAPRPSTQNGAASAEQAAAGARTVHLEADRETKATQPRREARDKDRRFAPPAAQFGGRPRKHVVRDDNPQEEGPGFFAGRVVSLPEDGSLAAIQCAETGTLYGNAFIQAPRGMFPQAATVGLALCFTLELGTDGQPLPGEPYIVGVGQAAQAGSFIGSVKGFTSTGGAQVGWATSLATQEIYNSDVYIHSSMVDGLGVGDVIRFNIYVNPKGQPQASKGSVKRLGRSGQTERLRPNVDRNV
eukprot:NODE_4832_length_1841_cov_2.602100.p1 GENE.NODE_4832_length_1841_cov_2.602100~~NODE_4832_length_1841_cov_2.602100.p1  ORF type:complete len:527 (+),score=74.57 NODE_4832_length_1841_cov_2.602100:91-1671(+)